MPNTNKALKDTFKWISKIAEDLMILASQKNERGIWLLANSIYSDTRELCSFYSMEKENEKESEVEDGE